MKKHLIIAASTLAVTGTAIGLTATSFVNAASDPSGVTTNTSSKHHDADQRHDRRHGRRQMLNARLNQAVRDGTITSAQRQAFLTEMKTLHKEARSTVNKSSTKAEHQAERAKIKSELQAWATANDFPLSKILPKLAS